jgi:hypothetical protein
VSVEVSSELRRARRSSVGGEACRTVSRCQFLWVMPTVLLSTMGEPGGQDTEKLMVSPEAALPTTPGSEPGPEPEQVVTVSVLALATCAWRTTIEMVARLTMRLARRTGPPERGSPAFLARSLLPSFPPLRERLRPG